MDPFESFLKDQVHLLRSTGERSGPYKTALTEGRCSISDLSLEIAPGDVIVHRQEDKSEHHYPVRSVKRREEFHGIPGGLDLILGKKQEVAPPPKRQTGDGRARDGSPAAHVNGHRPAASPAGGSVNGARRGGNGAGNGKSPARDNGRHRDGNGALAAVARNGSARNGTAGNGAAHALQQARFERADYHLPANEELGWPGPAGDAIHDADMKAIHDAFAALGRIIDSQNVSDEARVYARDRLNALSQHPIVIKVMVNFPGSDSDG